MEATTEWNMGGGGTHSSPTALGLGISQGGHTILENKFPDFSLTNFRFSLIAILDNIAVYLHSIVIFSSKYKHDIFLYIMH